MYHSELFGIFAAYSSNHECQVYMPKGEVLHLPPLSYHYGTSVHSTKRSTIEQSSTTQPHTDFKPRFIELLQDFSTSIPILSDIMSAARTQHKVNVRFSHYLCNRKIPDSFFECRVWGDCFPCQVLAVTPNIKALVIPTLLGITHDDALSAYMESFEFEFIHPASVGNFIQMLNPTLARGIRRVRLSFGVPAADPGHDAQPFERTSNDWTYDLARAFHMISSLPNLQSLDITFSDLWLDVIEEEDDSLTRRFDGTSNRPEEQQPIFLSHILFDAGIKKIRGLQEASLTFCGLKNDNWIFASLPHWRDSDWMTEIMLMFARPRSCDQWYPIHHPADASDHIIDFHYAENRFSAMMHKRPEEARPTVSPVVNVNGSSSHIESPLSRLERDTFVETEHATYHCGGCGLRLER